MSYFWVAVGCLVVGWYSGTWMAEADEPDENCPYCQNTGVIVIDGKVTP